MPARVPFLNLAAAHEELGLELDNAGARHCVGVGNGLEALHLALLAMEVGMSDPDASRASKARRENVDSEEVTAYSTADHDGV